MTSTKTIALVLALAAAMALPAAALSRADNYVLCGGESFTHVPVGKASRTIAFRMTALKGKNMVATSCKRGQAVIQAGFTKFGKKTLSYSQIGKLRVVVHLRRYTFAQPVPAGGDRYAWTGAGTRIQYRLPH